MITHRRKRKSELPLARNGNEGHHIENHQSETQSIGFRLMDLPSSIIIEILKRMPIEEVLQCRSACRTLCQLMFDPSFINHFLKKSHFLNLVYLSKSRKIVFAKLEGDEIGALKTLDVSVRHIPQEDDLELVGSSKGFLCLLSKSSNTNTLHITNPLLGEYTTLSKPFGDKHVTIDETYWFGYIPSLRRFKVISIKVRRALLHYNPHKYFNKSEVHVLVIGSNTWKYAGDAPFPRHGKFCKIILNGCLHWMVGDNRDSLQLHAFDVKEDRVHSFPSPPKLESVYSIVEVEVMGNYLSLIGCSSDHELVEIWFMKEYGVISSWAKYITVRIVRNLFLPTTFEKDEELKFLWYHGLVLSYDPTEKKYTGSSHLGSKRKDDIWIYTPSFLSVTHSGSTF